MNKEVLLNKINDFTYKIPKEYDVNMNTDAILFSNESMLSTIKKDDSIQQLINMATLPGVVGNVCAMPDIHYGYGFPIGGVAAFDANEGVVSPGGVGYDINCGVRLIKTDLLYKDVRDKIELIINTLFKYIPAGVGSRKGSSSLKLTVSDMNEILSEGANWAIAHGYGYEKDKEVIEESGKMIGVDTSSVSEKAKERGLTQIGTIGGGNHFIEIQVVDEILDAPFAKRCGIHSKDQIVIMIHTGSRGTGHQIGTDYISIMNKSLSKYKISIVDKQLALAPIESEEGMKYISAMRAGANFAWANREVITDMVRKAFSEVFRKEDELLGIDVVYDIAHNIAKIEKHKVSGSERNLLVHRKGATRAFPAGNENVAERYRDIGQPVLIPGDMGTNSYILYGLPDAMNLSFGSTCHGAGRMMSRAAATRKFSYNDVKNKLNENGIYIRSASKEGIVEEAPGAYKNVNEVVAIAEGAGLSKISVKLRPIGVMKG